MPRQARLDAAGTLHHIMVRGIEMKRIFDDDLDRKGFVTGRQVQEIIATSCKKEGISIQELQSQENGVRLRYLGIEWPPFSG